MRKSCHANVLYDYVLLVNLSFFYVVSALAFIFQITVGKHNETICIHKDSMFMLWVRYIFVPIFRSCIQLCSVRCKQYCIILARFRKKYANCTKSLEFGIHWQTELQVKTKFFLLAAAN